MLLPWGKRAPAAGDQAQAVPALSGVVPTQSPGVCGLPLALVTALGHHMFAVCTAVCDSLAESSETEALLYPSLQMWGVRPLPTQWHSQSQSPGTSPRALLPLDGGGSALTAGLRPSLSRVFLLRGPSMVGTVAELPSVQMHGPVGLGGDHWSDTALEEPRSGTSPPQHSTAKSMMLCQARGLNMIRAGGPALATAGHFHLPRLSKCLRP